MCCRSALGQGTSPRWLPSYPSRLHRRILRSLLLAGATTPEAGIHRQRLVAVLRVESDRTGEPYLKSHAITSRISELKGMGLVDMRLGEIRVRNGDSPRYSRKPLWWLTQAGLEAARSE